ncbi:hypothetical protein CHS0354_022071 [Potamilus streckersoni]|uniref:Uncharacterized protein n=1 Tax=Potamilus streckersoni TaxID=2493646 RepID=A0AAE0SRY5_9BIVA|nr:hypothetical protein CHS0354_022071 [Potamilus streckersoni]
MQQEGAEKCVDFDDLAKVIIFRQNLMVASETVEPWLAAQVEEYVQNALNDPDGEIGIIFYRAIVSKNAIQGKQEIDIDFHLISQKRFGDEEKNKLKTSYLNRLMLSSNNIVTLKSERVIEIVKEEKREPVFHHVDSEEVPGYSKINGGNFITKFFHYWLIIPPVQWRFFDLVYQLYTFDIMHFGFVSKFVHFFTIPANVIFSMSFLAQFSIFGNSSEELFMLNASTIFLLFLSIMYMTASFVWRCWEWGVATSAVLFVCWMGGNMWYWTFMVEGNSWYNPTYLWANPIIWSYLASIVQAGSHMCSPQLPPYITGVDHWESLPAFFCQKSTSAEQFVKRLCFRFMAILSYPTLSTAVSWFSWPHLIGIEVFYILGGIGFKPKFFQDLLRVAEKEERSGNAGLHITHVRPSDVIDSCTPFKSESYQLLGNEICTIDMPVDKD